MSFDTRATHFSGRLRASLASLALLALLPGAVPAQAASEAGAEALEEIPVFADRGFSVQLDNDLFSGAHRDEDYSWGAAVTFASPQTRRVFRPLDSIRSHIANWLTPASLESASVMPGKRAAQIGIIGMTPDTLKSDEPIYGDRPFASLLFLSVGELQVMQGGNRARFSSLTIGALGLDLAGRLHAGVHKLVGDEKPHGWQHQISAGGEPTARYMQAEQWLLQREDPRATGPELKLTAAGSAGFITEASVALSARWGRIQTPWWSFTPELSDYISAPVAPITVLNPSGLTELYGFAGARLKARAYNALLQGQFRHSDVRVASGDLARIHGEAWVGVASRWNDWQFAYTLRYASRETTREPGARSLIWAGINFQRTF
jgi:hypothetical protein